MWREYSSGYIRNNRSSGITVIAAAFLSALLLSLLCGVFYNLWKYEVERIEREEGSWQSRITGEFDSEEIRAVQSFAGVTKVEVREEESGETVLDLYFQNMSQVLEDTPKAARLAGASKEDVTYHHALLSMYLVRDPEDPAPRLVFPFFMLVTLLARLYEKYRDMTYIQGTLRGLRPAIVALIAAAGVNILILALTGEGEAAFNFIGLGLFAAAFVVLRRWKPNPIYVMLGCGVLGGLLYPFTGGV